MFTGHFCFQDRRHNPLAHLSQTGGNEGIRTLDTFRCSSLAKKCNRPLCHVSKTFTFRLCPSKRSQHRPYDFEALAPLNNRSSALLTSSRASNLQAPGSVMSCSRPRFHPHGPSLLSRSIERHLLSLASSSLVHTNLVGKSIARFLSPFRGDCHSSELPPGHQRARLRSGPTWN